MRVFKIYCAGFDVFSPVAKEIAKSKKKVCRNLDFEALTPMDNESDNPQEIFHNNELLINHCDCLVANLNDFKGKDIDSGTAFEIGYAYALHIPVFGYLNDTRSLIEKNRNQQLTIVDNTIYKIENFNLPVNLMIAQSCKEIIKGNFTDCIVNCVVPYFKNIPLEIKEKE